MGNLQAETKKWIELNKKWALGVDFKQQDSTAIAFERLYSSDPRGAEAQVLTANPISLVELRMRILRGQFEQSSQLIENLKKHSSDEKTLNEIFHEEACQAGLNFDWQKGLDLTNHLIESNVDPSSRLAQWQLRAVFLYETGAYLKAFNDLQQAQSLLDLFPNSAVIGTLKGIEAKVNSKILNAEDAQSKLDEFWKSRIKEDKLSLDNLLTALRLEIHFLRLKGKYYGDYARACRWLSKTTGENYYESFALIEEYFSVFTNKSNKEIETICQQYPALGRMRSAILEKDHSFSTTASDIIYYREAIKEQFSTKNPIDGKTIHSIFWPKLNCLINLKPFKTHSFKANHQIAKALELLTSEPLKKSEAFSKIWGSQKYAAHLHDGLLRNLALRLRKKYNINVSIADGSVLVEGVAVLK